MVVAVGVFTWLVVRQCWLAEDAYIMFRTIDNFVHGFGLRWNIGERVQSYTHPLWMLLVTVVYAVVRDLHLAALALSVATSLAAVLLLAFRVARTPAHAVVAISLLTLSRSVIEFSTGGFENCLTHLLVVSFAWFYLLRDSGCRTLAWIAGLLAFNRLDTVLIALSALLEVSYQLVRTKGWIVVGRELAIGLSPLMT